jgi:predicted HicB family RNase H-like nuclease
MSRTYYIIKRVLEYDEIVRAHSIRAVRNAVYKGPKAKLVRSIKKATTQQVKNYLQRTGKTRDEIRIIKPGEQWYLQADN